MLRISCKFDKKIDKKITATCTYLIPYTPCSQCSRSNKSSAGEGDLQSSEHGLGQPMHHMRLLCILMTKKFMHTVLHVVSFASKSEKLQLRSPKCSTRRPDEEYCLNIVHNPGPDVVNVHVH